MYLKRFLLLLAVCSLIARAAELTWNAAPAPVRDRPQNLTLLPGPHLKSPPGEPWLDHQWKTVRYVAPEVPRSSRLPESRAESKRSTDAPPQTSPSHDVLKFDLKVPPLQTTLGRDQRS